jgi:hypothetical protein
VRVGLRGEDLAAGSALEVLRDQMGARDVASLARETVWEIDAAAAGARERLAAIARGSWIFANPVKERWSIDEGALRIPRARDGRRVVGVLVRERPDRRGQVGARALTVAWDGARVSVRCATLWLLDLPDRGREATLARAREVAITTRRDQGLLSNPHCQDVEFLVD